MSNEKSPWSDPDLVRKDQSADPDPVDPKDQNEKPTHEQTNSPGSSKKQNPKFPYPDRSKY